MWLAGKTYSTERRCPASGPFSGMRTVTPTGRSRREPPSPRPSLPGSRRGSRSGSAPSMAPHFWYAARAEKAKYRLARYEAHVFSSKRFPGAKSRSLVPA
ncbi:MAG: hypothetical protein AMXMBFR53_27100 [Gemmatimonadota bacterium]